MDPLTTPGGRRHVEAQLSRLLDILAEDEALDADEEDGWHDRVYAGVAFELDEAGVVEHVLVLPLRDWDPEPKGGSPDGWMYEIGHPAGREASGAALLDALRLAVVGDPTDALAAAIAREGEARGWPGLRLAPGFRAWARRNGTWTPITPAVPSAPPAFPDLPHVSRWIGDEATAARVRRLVAALVADVRAALTGLGSSLCGVALFAIDDGPIGLGYLFALTEAGRDAHPDPARLLLDPGSWPERTPLPDDDEEEAEALAESLIAAGCFEPEAAIHREVADRLRVGPWGDVAVADDLVVLTSAG